MPDRKPPMLTVAQLREALNEYSDDDHVAIFDGIGCMRTPKLGRPALSQRDFPQSNTVAIVVDPRDKRGWA